ncbi:flavin monoamine oxidase family protein [Pleionea sp. CnH1-48]|uniref:flavin monoamine oxidase family protein n=1 Tax=Pleionea sp. CnH1-48 TaxID=2954494 RepID=UPI002096E558|nr:FAD-dependent oxidoreductase [Pleionea sp. CnH1-48]MCO7226383.1 FAD-dependent oxidoreductase [Pleionea sp. CnH1-48]
MPGYGLLSNLSPSLLALSEHETARFPAVIDTLYNYETFLNKVKSQPIASFEPSQRNARVAVIGAGQAGMVAAYELLRAGLKPVVFEASSRLGGRAWSKTQDDAEGAIAEMGAMRFPHTAAFTHYVNEFDLTLSNKFPDPGKVPTLLYYQNERFRWEPNASQPPGIFAQIQKDWENFLSSLGVDEITACLRNGQYQQAQSHWQGLITRYKDVSFLTAIVEGIPKWGTKQLGAFGALGIGSGGFGPLYQVCFLEMLRLIVDGLEYKQQLLLEGISSLPKNFYEKEVLTPDGEHLSLRKLDSIRWKHEVAALEYLGDSSHRIKLSFADRTIEEEVFDSVIVATTTRSMEVMGMTLGNTIKEPVKNGVRKVHMMNSSKMFVFTEDKFWLKDKSLPQNIQTDELVRGLYCLDYGKQTDKGVLLVSYTWGDDSTKLIAIEPEQRYQLLYDNIKDICPEFAQHIDRDNARVMNVDWQREPHYYGAFKVDYPGQETYVRDLYYQFQTSLRKADCISFDTGVYLAGDSVSWQGGWTEGALQTGINAACAVAHHLGGKVIEESPLTQNPASYEY